MKTNPRPILQPWMPNMIFASRNLRNVPRGTLLAFLPFQFPTHARIQKVRGVFHVEHSGTLPNSIWRLSSQSLPMKS